jgi:DNA-binding MarR family transcriptional regulator
MLSRLDNELDYNRGLVPRQPSCLVEAKTPELEVIMGSVADESRFTEAWTGARVAAEAYGIAAAITRGDASELHRLWRSYGSELVKQAAHPSLPADPWTNGAVVYGAILALSEVASVGTRVVVPISILVKLMSSSEARTILLVLAAQPGGMMPQAEIPKATGIARTNAQPQIKYLIELELIQRHAIGGEGSRYVLELTSLGWAAVRTLRRLGVQPRPGEEAEKGRTAGQEMGHQIDSALAAMPEAARRNVELLIRETLLDLLRGIDHQGNERVNQQQIPSIPPRRFAEFFEHVVPGVPRGFEWN